MTRQGAGDMVARSERVAARWRAAERVVARRRAVEAAGGGEDEGARGVESGVAKTRWHGAGDGGAPVSGLAGSSSKAARAWRRQSSGGARGWRRSRRRDGRDDGGAAQIRKMPKCWRKVEVERHI